jgi:hypothetical protein
VLLITLLFLAPAVAVDPRSPVLPVAVDGIPLDAGSGDEPVAALTEIAVHVKPVAPVSRYLVADDNGTDGGV